MEENKKIEEMTLDEFINGILDNEQFKKGLSNDNLKHLDNIIRGVTELGSNGISSSMWIIALMVLTSCFKGNEKPWGTTPANTSISDARFIVIDNFNGNINIVTNSDGEVMVFDDYEKALEEARQCQNGKVHIL